MSIMQRFKNPALGPRKNSICLLTVMYNTVHSSIFVTAKNNSNVNLRENQYINFSTVTQVKYYTTVKINKPKLLPKIWMNLRKLSLRIFKANVHFYKSKK